MALNSTNFRFAHRFLPDSRVEFICMECLAVVGTIQQGQDACPLLSQHSCELIEKACGRTN
jgi:hypothetical protein